MDMQVSCIVVFALRHVVSIFQKAFYLLQVESSTLPVSGCSIGYMTTKGDSKAAVELQVPDVREHCRSSTRGSCQLWTVASLLPVVDSSH